MVASAADEAGQTVASGNRKRATVLDRVDHVIVLMLTGRSFDQLLGALRLAGRGDIDGLQGDESNEWQGRRFVVHALDDPQHPPPFSPPTVFAPRPPSGRASTWQQLLGHPPYWDARAAWAHCTPGDAPQPTMGGFVQAFATGHRPGPPVSAPGTESRGADSLVARLGGFA